MHGGHGGHIEHGVHGGHGGHVGHGNYGGHLSNTAHSVGYQSKGQKHQGSNLIQIIIYNLLN